jgi:hypothetical protein
MNMPFLKDIPPFIFFTGKGGWVKHPWPVLLRYGWPIRVRERFW